MKFSPYWLDTAPQGPDRSRTEMAGHANMAKVGAGLTGLPVALHLARKGAGVADLEKEAVAKPLRPTVRGRVLRVPAPHQGGEGMMIGRDSQHWRNRC